MHVLNLKYSLNRNALVFLIFLAFMMGKVVFVSSHPLWGSDSNEFANLKERTSKYKQKPPTKKLSTKERYKSLETFHNDILTMIVKNFYTPEEFLALRSTSKTLKKETEKAVKRIYTFHPAAKTVYALMLLHGYGVKKDDSPRAHFYLRDAAKQGDPKACYWTGRKFIAIETKAWHRKALEWYKGAADKKYSSACEVYGALLLLGYGIDKNLKQAKKYLSCTQTLILNPGSNNTTFRQEELELVVTLTSLKTLYLNGYKIGDAGAKSLSALTNLTSLSLEQDDIGTAEAKALSALTKLTSLNLRHNDIGDDGIKALSTLTNLTSLNLASNQVKPEGTKYLSALTNLTTLTLPYFNKIGVNGLRALCTLTNLTSLELGWNRISVSGGRQKLKKQIEKNKLRKIQNK